MKVRWSRPALRDLEAVLDHIAAENPTAAMTFADRTFGLADRLARFPEAGRIGRIGGTREALVNGTPYLLAYRIGADRLEILAVLHGARRWPDDLE